MQNFTENYKSPKIIFSNMNESCTSSPEYQKPIPSNPSNHNQIRTTEISEISPEIGSVKEISALRVPQVSISTFDSYRVGERVFIRRHSWINSGFVNVIF